MLPGLANWAQPRKTRMGFYLFRIYYIFRIFIICSDSELFVQNLFILNWFSLNSLVVANEKSRKKYYFMKSRKYSYIIPNQFILSYIVYTQISFLNITNHAHFDCNWNGNIWKFLPIFLFQVCFQFRPVKQNVEKFCSIGVELVGTECRDSYK